MTAGAMNENQGTPAFIFDLDGTLIDSVYQHVLAWREALEQAGIELSVWRIHRRIGVSGGLLVNALLRETSRNISPAEAERLQRFHTAAYEADCADPSIAGNQGTAQLSGRGGCSSRDRHERTYRERQAGA